MIDLRELREALAEIKISLPQIKTHKLVSTDDRFVDKLERHKKEDNTLLVTVMPAFKGFVAEEKNDLGGFRTYLQFFILNKIDYKTEEPEDVQIELQPLVQDFIKALAEHETNDCYTFGNMDWSSISIMGVTNKASCCGWEIQIDDQTYSGIDGRTE